MWFLASHHGPRCDGRNHIHGLWTAQRLSTERASGLAWGSPRLTLLRVVRHLPLPPEQLGAFTTAQAEAAGWTQAGLRHAVRHGRLDRLWPGAYAAPVPSTPAGRDRRTAQLAVAASLTNSGTLVSHLGAAAVYGWGWWAEAPRACVTTPVGALSAVPLGHVHRVEVADRDRWQAGGLLLTSPARTVVDVAREFGVESAVTIGDAALRAGALSREDLARALHDARGRPRVGAARAAATGLDGRSESVLESRSRHRMAVAGLPPPRTQVDVFGVDRRWVARVDFYWEDYGVVGEADGELKYAGGRSLIREKWREDALRGLGLGFVRWGWTDLEPFAPTARRLRGAFDRGAPATARSRWRAEPTDVVPGVTGRVVL